MPSLILVCALRLSSPAQLIVSEVMADPAAIPDAQGEFLELANAGREVLHADDLTLWVDGDSARLPLRLGPGEILLLCRDTSRAANGGMECGRLPAGIGLANGRGLEMALAWAGKRDTFAIPPSRPGVSWENTFEGAAGLRRFLPSVGAWTGGDSATPGSRNSRSARAPYRDLGITEVTWEADGTLRVDLENRGQGPPPGAGLSIRLDADWDGDAETLCDSLVLASADWAAGKTALRIPLGAGARGLAVLRLDRDENPANDVRRLPRWESRPLEITEACPAPPEDGTEWVEIRNASPDRLHLAQVTMNGLPLGNAAGGPLRPGEYLVIAEDAAAFRARYGPLKIRLFQPPGWRTLRNSGDTVRLAVAGYPLDGMAYAAKNLGAGNACVAREPAGQGPGGDSTAVSPGDAATPGYSLPRISGWSWSLSAGKVDAGRPDQPLYVEVAMPADGEYILQVFDLEGNCVRDLGRGGGNLRGGRGGRQVHRWGGDGRNGGRLAPGAYILCLRAAGRDALKKAVIVEGPR